MLLQSYAYYMNLFNILESQFSYVLVDAVSVTTMEPCGNFAFVAQRTTILTFTRGHRPLSHSIVATRAKLEWLPAYISYCHKHYASQRGSVLALTGCPVVGDIHQLHLIAYQVPVNRSHDPGGSQTIWISGQTHRSHLFSSD